MSESDISVTAIYHRVLAREDFKQAAGMLFTMVRDTARKYRGRERVLYLDIDGHCRGRRYDRDMSSLLNGFIPQVLLPYLTAARLTSGNLDNAAQQEDVPDGVLLTDDTEPCAVMLGYGDDGWTYLRGHGKGLPGIRRVILYTRDSTQSRYQAEGS